MTVNDIDTWCSMMLGKKMGSCAQRTAQLSSMAAAGVTGQEIVPIPVTMKDVYAARESNSQSQIPPHTFALCRLNIA